MTDFVTLCQRVRQECGMAGDGPTTTIGQTNMLKKVVDRTQRAWIDIQASKPYWKFLRTTLSYPLVVAQQSYVVSTATPTGFGLTSVDKWDQQTAFIYKTSTSDETPLKWISYQDFRKRFRTYPSGRPDTLCEGPGGTVLFNKTPDYAYTITLGYWQTPEKLVNPTDVPALPEQYCDVIVWKSMMMFSGTEMAPDLMQYARMMYSAAYTQLVLDQCDVPSQVKHFPLAAGRGTTKQTFSEAS